MVHCRIIDGIFEYRHRDKKPRPLPPIQSDILLLSATQLAKKIRQRELTSVEVLQTYIDRIKKVNSEMLLQNIPERPIGQIRAFLLKLAHSITLLKFGKNADK